MHAIAIGNVIISWDFLVCGENFSSSYFLELSSKTLRKSWHSGSAGRDLRARSWQMGVSLGRDDRSQPAKPTATGREEIMRKMENSLAFLVSLGQQSMGKFNENSQSFLSTRCRETSKNHLSLSSANQLMRIVTHCHITGDDRCVSLLFCVLRAALQFPQESERTSGEFGEFHRKFYVVCESSVECERRGNIQHRLYACQSKSMCVGGTLAFWIAAGEEECGGKKSHKSVAKRRHRLAIDTN